MNVPSIYRCITENPEVVDILGWPFDFEICEPFLLSNNWPILLSKELVVLAEDGTGGAYTILENIEPEKSPVVFLSSEGQAGMVAANLAEFIAVMVALPYWRDLLKFSASGKLSEMYKAVPFLKREELEDEPDIFSKKDVIYQALILPHLADPVQTLFDSVMSGINIEINATDGTPYEGLFNTFSVSDNKSWKR
ncbi:hypothetical protein ONV78_26265 [Hahella sp. CR1]|uniref:hypothetical protein n=1 Tax=Hahella sp. CR1 TaxID=2992807 RepID=UPI0024418C90|nr:hypothetical protein [Hahella sp. CR1]MDG9671266.1 hypothetical protein [Hahella sp. CR1]